jgi:ketosteroid isomerase-like protein
MERSTKEIADVLVAMWKVLDFGKLAPLLAENAVYTAGGPARGSRREGKEAVLASHQRAVGQVFTIEKAEVREVLVTADRVAIGLHVDGKSRITGRPYANDLLYLYSVEGGKIVHQHEYLDTIASARATGDLPYPD